MVDYAACVVYSARGQSPLLSRSHAGSLAEFSNRKVHGDSGGGANLCPDYSVKAVCLGDSVHPAQLIPELSYCPFGLDSAEWD
jgi:hypothetical protein